MVVINHVSTGMILQVVGGFNPVENMLGKLDHFQFEGVKFQKSLKPPSSLVKNDEFETGQQGSGWMTPTRTMKTAYNGRIPQQFVFPSSLILPIWVI